MKFFAVFLKTRSEQLKQAGGRSRKWQTLWQRNFKVLHLRYRNVACYITQNYIYSPMILTTYLQKFRLGPSKPEIHLKNAVPTSQKAHFVAVTKPLLNFV
jgi:hypothetical protein